MKRFFLLALLTTICISYLNAQGAEKGRYHWQANNSRLFTSPVEREKLDTMRQAASLLALQTKEIQTEPDKQKPAIALPAEITMQGYIKRKDGKKSTVWINHQALQENTLNDDVQVGIIGSQSEQVSQSILLKLSSNGQKFKLKAGQRYLPDEHRVVDIDASGLKEKNEN